MNRLYAQPEASWFDALRADVDRAFEVTGADTPGWPNPHPDRAPLDEEYSRLLDAAKYRILGARAEAWIRALSDVRMAETLDVENAQWIGSTRPMAAVSAVRQIRPTVREGLSLLLATTLVDGEPFGLDVAVAKDGERPVLLDRVPFCGCDGWQGAGDPPEDWLDESSPVVDGMSRWIGTPWR